MTSLFEDSDVFLYLGLLKTLKLLQQAGLSYTLPRRINPSHLTYEGLDLIDELLPEMNETLRVFSHFSIARFSDVALGDRSFPYVFGFEEYFMIHRSDWEGTEPEDGEASWLLCFSSPFLTTADYERERNALKLTGFPSLCEKAYIIEFYGSDYSMRQFESEIMDLFQMFARLAAVIEERKQCTN